MRICVHGYSRMTKKTTHLLRWAFAMNRGSEVNWVSSRRRGHTISGPKRALTRFNGLCPKQKGEHELTFLVCGLATKLPEKTWILQGRAVWVCPESTCLSLRLGLPSRHSMYLAFVHNSRFLYLLYIPVGF